MKKILLATSDAFLINVYATCLRKLGYTISIARDGEVVANRIQAINPDLLIVDASLPKINGINLLKFLRKDLGMVDLKVVMLSNFNFQEAMRENEDLGVASYFLKSEHTSEEFAQEITRILN